MGRDKYTITSGGKIFSGCKLEVNFKNDASFSDLVCIRQQSGMGFYGGLTDLTKK